MTLSTEQVVAGLRALLGDGAVVSEPSQMSGYLNEPRKRFHTPAVAVARPGSVAEVQALCRWANDNVVPLIPQGGNTGLVGGQVPLQGNEVIVSITRLNAVREVNAGAGHMTVEAGLTLHGAREAAEAAGALFPLWIASYGSARIGGILGSNAGGVQVLAYGNARDLCLGIEAVLADGRLYNGLGSLRKDNTGFDLKNLLIGSEGTLAITTAATLKLFPQPEAVETAVCNVADPAAALELFYLIRERTNRRLTGFEIVPRFGVDLQLKHGMLARDPTPGLSPWYVLCEVNRMRGGVAGVLQAALEKALERGLISNAVLAQSESDRQEMWAMREQMSDVQSREGASIKHDVSVPVAAVPRLIAEGSAAAERLVPGIRPCPFGHLGDGNIHFNFSQPVGADAAEFMASADDPLHDVIYEIVVRLGGSVSAEHGIGQLKAALLQQVKDPVALELMRSIKQTLDPNGIMNPGKVLAL